MTKTWSDGVWTQSIQGFCRPDICFPWFTVHTHGARNLKVIVDSDLNVSKHMSNITRSAIGQIRSITKIGSFLFISDAKTLIHCQSLFAGLPQKCIHRLQLVQNTTASFLTRTQRYEHFHYFHLIAPVTCGAQNWLKLNSMFGLAPSYMIDLLSLYNPGKAWERG